MMDWPKPLNGQFYLEYEDVLKRQRNGSSSLKETATPSSAKQRTANDRSLQSDANQDDASRSSERHNYILDSGASFHCIYEGDLDDAELATVEFTDAPIEFATANGICVSQKRARAQVAPWALWAQLSDRPKGLLVASHLHGSLP